MPQITQTPPANSMLVQVPMPTPIQGGGSKQPVQGQPVDQPDPQQQAQPPASPFVPPADQPHVLIFPHSPSADQPAAPARMSRKPAPKQKSLPAKPESPVRFAEGRRISLSRVHPEIRWTRLAHVLNRWQAGDRTSEGAAIARQILSGPPVRKGEPHPHSQPMDLTPFYALSDWAQEHPEHPMAGVYNWHSLPRSLVTDQILHQYLMDHPGPETTRGGMLYGQKIPQNATEDQIEELRRAITQRGRLVLPISIAMTKSKDFDFRNNGTIVVNHRYYSGITPDEDDEHIRFPDPHRSTADHLEKMWSMLKQSNPDATRVDLQKSLTRLLFSNEARQSSLSPSHSMSGLHNELSVHPSEGGMRWKRSHAYWLPSAISLSHGHPEDPSSEIANKDIDEAERYSRRTIKGE